MRTILKIFLLLSLSFLFSNISASEPFKESFKGQELKALCDSQSKQDNTKCMTFIKGVRGGMFAQRLFLGFTHNSLKITMPPQLKSMLLKEPFCIPPSESDSSIGKKIAQYLSEIPEKCWMVLQVSWFCPDLILSTNAGNI